MKRAPTAKVKIETCHIDMIADSGSTVNIMSHKTYQLIQPVPTLKSAKGEKLFHKEGNFNNREVPMHFRIKALLHNLYILSDQKGCSFHFRGLSLQLTWRCYILKTGYYKPSSLLVQRKYVPDTLSCSRHSKAQSNNSKTAHWWKCHTSYTTTQGNSF